ncbi:MAG: DUF3137 domain-containing protein [Flammeovirgaceae bacterium]|nr:DUF3137 domain-containing protein [Flammeovirgaceae bacterium]
MKFSEQGLPWDMLNASGLNMKVKNERSTFISNNMTEGVIHDYSIRFGFCHQHFTSSSTDSKGKTTRSQVDAFKNTLLVMDSPVRWAGQTHVLTDVTERMIGSMFSDLANKFLSDNEPVIRFNENPEFEKYFKVHSDNENETRTILSQHMQVWIMGIFRKLGRIQLSFKEDKIYVEIPTYVPETIDDFDINWYIEAISKYQIISMGIAEDLISIVSHKQYETSALQKAYHEMIVAAPDKEDITDQLMGFTGKAGKGCLFFISIMIIFFGSMFTLIGLIMAITTQEWVMLFIAGPGIAALYVGIMLLRKSRKKSPVKTQ